MLLQLFFAGQQGLFKRLIPEIFVDVDRVVIAPYFVKMAVHDAIAPELLYPID